MPDQTVFTLAAYRLSKAEDCYLAAKHLYENGPLTDSANRSYDVAEQLKNARVLLDAITLYVRNQRPT